MKNLGICIVTFVLIGCIFAGYWMLQRICVFPEKAKQIKCKANLEQIAKAMSLYKRDYGDDSEHPNAIGGGFIARYMATNIISDPKIYLCPSTCLDIVTKEALVELGASTNISTGDTTNATSYAGRDNRNNKKYPGLFRLYFTDYTTTVASDDWQNDTNHEGGQYVNFLFHDGHLEREINKNVKQRYEDISPAEQAKAYSYYIKSRGLAQPLTN